MRSRSFWARQPPTTICMSGRRCLSALSWPRLPYSLLSAFSRMQQVLSTTTSAASTDAARSSPSASSRPAMRSESCSFIWHPKVRTKYVRVTTGKVRRAGTDRPASFVDPAFGLRRWAFGPSALGSRPGPSALGLRPLRSSGPDRRSRASTLGRAGTTVLLQVDGLVVGRGEVVGTSSRAARGRAAHARLLTHPLGDLDHDLRVLGEERLG